MTLRFLRRAGALALVLAGCAAQVALAAAEPAAGQWTGDPVTGRGGAKAELRFTVTEGTVVPTVQYKMRRCGRLSSATLAPAPITDGRFKARRRGHRGAARIDLRLRGTFDSELEAHGTVRATVKLRRKGKRITCKLPKLAWTAELTAPVEEEVRDEPDESSEDEADDDFEYPEEEDPEDDEGQYDETPDPAE